MLLMLRLSYRKRRKNEALAAGAVEESQSDGDTYRPGPNVELGQDPFQI